MVDVLKHTVECFGGPLIELSQLEVTGVSLHLKEEEQHYSDEGYMVPHPLNSDLDKLLRDSALVRESYRRLPRPGGSSSVLRPPTPRPRAGFAPYCVMASVRGHLTCQMLYQTGLCNKTRFIVCPRMCHEKFN